MTEPTAFLYPFIERDESGADQLLAALAASAADKIAASRRLAEATLTEHDATIAAAAAALAAGFAAGGRLFCAGNGGSATDAAAAAHLFSSPGPTGRTLPARSLADDTAVLTALANDVGFDLVFTRQLIAHGRAGDVLLALSTSGNSGNLAAALAHSRRAGILTVGLAGHDGGAMAEPGAVDHLVVVASDSVHRIQETHAAVLHRLWRAVHQALDHSSPQIARPQGAPPPGVEGATR